MTKGRYPRQYLLWNSPSIEIPEELTETMDLGEGWKVAHHPLLPVTLRRLEGGGVLACLGSIYSPFHPEWGDQDVLGCLSHCSSFSEFEEALSRTAGRYVLFVRTIGECRLYNDACGMRSAFYTMKNAGVAVASQPGFLAQDAVMSNREKYIERLMAADACVFPVSVLPYDGVDQLLPNHYLDLNQGTSIRFWPRGPIRQYSLEDAAEKIATLWRGSVLALINRYSKLTLPITAGYDSRAILAAGWNVRDQLCLFTIVDPLLPFKDWWVPPKISRASGCRLRRVWAAALSANDTREIRENTAFLWRDPNEHRNPAFRYGSTAVLLGTTSELLRHDRHWEILASTPEGVAKLQGWGGDAMAIDASRRWLESIPLNSRVDISDLFYWEVRLPTWSALDCLSLDAYTNPFSPTNCREILATALGTARDYRTPKSEPEASYLLYRRVLERNAPSLLAIPFNSTWLSPLGSVCGRVIPDRFKRGFARLWRRIVLASSGILLLIDGGASLSIVTTL